MSKEYKRLSFPTVSDITGRRKSIVSEITDRRKSIVCEFTGRRRSSNKTKVLVRIYQPTYQLNPRKRFNVEVVEKILRRIIDCELAEVEYSEKLVPELCLTLAETIRTAVKEENYDRYRIVVCVSIGQRRQQSVNVFHSFLWDHERDGFAAHTFHNCHLFANVVVYGVYLD